MRHSARNGPPFRFAQLIQMFTICGDPGLKGLTLTRSTKNGVGQRSGASAKKLLGHDGKGFITWKNSNRLICNSNHRSQNSIDSLI